MWKQSHTLTTKLATAEQVWKLFADVNNWHTWDDGTDWAKMEGEFVTGNHFTLKPKGGPQVQIKLVETTPYRSFTDMTKFPFATMYGEHVFEETDSGLRMTTTMSIEGPLAWVWRKIVAEDIVRSLPADLQKQAETASKL